MNHSAIINLVPGNTFLHKLTGTTKVRLFIVLIIYVTMSFDLPIILPLFIASIVALISLKPKWKTIRTIMIIVVLMNLFNIFLYWVADPNCGQIYNNDATVLVKLTNYFVITKGTLWYLGVRLLKMLTSFLISLVFIMSITPSEMAAGLTSLGLPYKFGCIVEIAFRYIPDISRDFENISISMQCRGLELDKKKTSPFKRMKQMILILIPLVITSFDRVGNIANAMDLRGFGKLNKRTYYAEHEPSKWDKVFMVIYILLFIFDIAYLINNGLGTRSTRMWIYW
ncbi:MAG: energy-coupling factor transporter transmembrane component T [Erysipelotrichaceae bacterium]|nr:energy-coupling factor transporter transmembrane component T [Erysipelotrichaceae bacterium]